MTTTLLDDAAVVQRILDHAARTSTDVSEGTWREPVAHYRSEERLAAERDVLRRSPTPFCPSAALPEPGSYLARAAAGTPLVAVRGQDGVARVFRNACRHRGNEVAAGAGCAKAFMCRYHGWTYALDGRLRHVPHADGFPGLDEASHGLVPVASAERDGLVWVVQEGDADPAGVDGLPGVIAPELPLVATTVREVPANWKILAEGFLEGYHIRTTHAETFYPVQFDNLNVVEAFGRNSRVAFPYRAVLGLAKKPRAAWSTTGRLTYVYHLFPNVMLATFPATVVMVVLEPLDLGRTDFITYALAARAEERRGDDRPALASAGTFLDAGATEDREVACAIQRGLASGANTHFTFGRFEGAIAHFHRTLTAALGEAPPA